MSIPTIAIFLLEVRGYSKLYDSTQHSYGIIPFIKEFSTFLFFTDMLIYFIHRVVLLGMTGQFHIRSACK